MTFYFLEYYIYNRGDDLVASKTGIGIQEFSQENLLQHFNQYIKFLHRDRWNINKFSSGEMKMFLVYMDYVYTQVCTPSSSAELESIQSCFCQSSLLPVWQTTFLLVLNILLPFTPDSTIFFKNFGNSHLQCIHPKMI